MSLHCAQSVHVSQWKKICPVPRGLQPLSSAWPIATWRHPCALQRQVLLLAAYRYQLWRICFTHICCMKVKLMRVKVSRHRCIWFAHVCVLTELPDSGKGRGAKQGLSGDPRDLSTVLWLEELFRDTLEQPKNLCTVHKPCQTSSCLQVQLYSVGRVPSGICCLGHQDLHLHCPYQPQYCEPITASDHVQHLLWRVVASVAGA
jgi:hypothetical protein